MSPWLDEEDVVWTSADGRRYRMSEIDDRHLKNIVAFLERQADAAEACVFLSEAAEDAAESAAARMRGMADEFRGELAARAAK